MKAISYSGNYILSKYLNNSDVYPLTNFHLSSNIEYCRNVKSRNCRNANKSMAHKRAM